MPRSTSVSNRDDQLLQQRDEPGVQGGRQGSTGCVQPGGQLMAAGDRLSGELPDQTPHRQLVRRVANTEVAGDGIRIHIVRLSQNRFPCRLDVERSRLHPGAIMSAADQHDSLLGDDLLGRQLPKQIGIVTDQQKTDRSALPLDNGIGGQGRRNRHQTDIGKDGRQDRLDGFSNPDGEIDSWSSAPLPRRSRPVHHPAALHPYRCLRCRFPASDSYPSLLSSDSRQPCRLRVSISAAPSN